MGAYTPTTESVLEVWVAALWEGIAGEEATDDSDWDEERRIAQFTRWLEAHDREVAEKAWDEGHAAGATDGITDTWDSVNPYREGASE